ncbi:MAG: hypothetical protein R3C45_07585 [Phycisphaerales bacterium]
MTINTVLDDGLDKKWWGHERDHAQLNDQRLLDDQRLETQYDPATKTVTAQISTSGLDEQAGTPHSGHPPREPVQAPQLPAAVRNPYPG